MSFGQGRVHFGSMHGTQPSPKASRLGWAVPFSEEYMAGGLRSHLLVDALTYRGLAYRLCKPGHVVNPAFAVREGPFQERCKKCELVERKEKACLPEA